MNYIRFSVLKRVGAYNLINYDEVKLLKKISLNYYYKKFDQLSSKDKFYLSLAVPNFYYLNGAIEENIDINNKQEFDRFKNAFDRTYNLDDDFLKCLGKTDHSLFLDEFTLISSYKFFKKYFLDILENLEEYNTLFEDIINFSDNNCVLMRKNNVALLFEEKNSVIEVSEYKLLGGSYSNNLVATIPSNSYLKDNLKDFILVNTNKKLKNNNLKNVLNKLVLNNNSILNFLDIDKDDVLNNLFKENDPGLIMDILI